MQYTDFLFIDTETFSETPIADGTLPYAENHVGERPVEVMLIPYAFNDEDVACIDLTAGDVIPKRVKDALLDPRVLKVMHNSAFDRAVARLSYEIKTDIPAAQIYDTMVQALAHGLPGGLDQLCDIYKVGEDLAKAKTGKELINLFCKPRPKNWKLRRATSETHPTEWQDFIDYACSDIHSMRYLFHKLPKWNYPLETDGALGCERALWILDQAINDRGYLIDVELAEAALSEIERTQKRLHKKTTRITNGAVEKATQRDALLKFIVDSMGVWLPDLKKSTLQNRLNDPDLPRPVRDLIAIRLASATTSTGKYKKILKAVANDDTAKMTLQFDGASRTRRWAGRGLQPQNLPRPTHKQSEIDQAIEDIKAGLGAELYGDELMNLSASCLRGLIVARPKKKLVVTDLSNIEGRFTAWISEEETKLQAFREYDNGEGPDLYIRAYSNMFGVAVDQVSKDDRQIGKVTELMLGYGGGVGAFITGALTYGIDLDELAEKAWPEIPFSVQREARDFCQWQSQKKGGLYGLDKKTFATCDALKRLWRMAHPNIASMWKELEEAVRKAVARKGKTVECRRLKIVCTGAWLRIIMPSGKCLCYASPRIVGGDITYMGLSPYSRKFKRLKTYGGKLLENISQSGSRDVMANNMPMAEAEGYSILLTVHDELITEAEDNDGYSVDELSRILATQPDWAPDLPLAAGGFEAHRYRKD